MIGEITTWQIEKFKSKRKERLKEGGEGKIGPSS